LSVVAEVVSTLDISSSHKCCVEGLEDHGDGGQKAGQVAAESGAQGQEPREQGTNSKEEGDQHEGEHEPSHVEVVGVMVDEIPGNVDLGVEFSVRGRVEWEGRMDLGEVLITTDSATILHAAHIPV